MVGASAQLVWSFSHNEHGCHLCERRSATRIASRFFFYVIGQIKVVPPRSLQHAFPSWPFSKMECKIFAYRIDSIMLCAFSRIFGRMMWVEPCESSLLPSTRALRGINWSFSQLAIYFIISHILNHSCIFSYHKTDVNWVLSSIMVRRDAARL